MFGIWFSIFEGLQPFSQWIFWKHCALMIPMHCKKDKGAFCYLKPFINCHKLQEKRKDKSK